MASRNTNSHTDTVFEASELRNIPKINTFLLTELDIFQTYLSEQLLSTTMQLSIFNLMTQLENYFFPSKIFPNDNSESLLMSCSVCAN